MALYAGELDLRCDGCGNRLDETRDIFGECCRIQNTNVVTIAEPLKHTTEEIRICQSAIDALLSGSLIAQVHARDALQEVSLRLGTLIP